MKSLKSAILYECMTSFRFVWIFYAAECAVVLLIMSVAALAEGGLEGVSTKCLELNTLFYVAILGGLGFQEDFKMLIQNGFTRKYIFAATGSMFCFISGTMALVDTAAGHFLHYLSPDYSSLFGSIYGYGHLAVNWLWLFLLYTAVCSLMYFIILVINKAGKTGSICLGVGFGALILLTVGLFQYVFSAETIDSILEFLMRTMGFMADGTVNLILPVLTLLVLTVILGGGVYAVIRRIELRK